MSLIYAHKTHFGIRVLSDTKPSVHPDDLDRLKNRFTVEEYNNFMKYGVVKTVIYKPNITISSAGMLEHFNKLLEYLETNNIIEVEDILKTATDIHNRYNKDTDFVITTERDIYEIKNGKYEKVEFSWIGDIDAFSKFQEQKLQYVIDERKYSNDFPKEDIEALKEHDRIKYAFQKVVDDKNIDSVGGFITICAISNCENSEYEFLSRIGIFSGYDSKQVLNPGDNIIFFHKVYDGGFQYQILDSKSKFLIYLEQTKLGIVYKNGYSDNEYKNLSLPFLVHCSYEEFLDKYSDVEQSIQIN
ncbi:MAG: hypothetical protein ILA19_03605 [Bacilli bacterium]|nr:hypothetical protein [Bacilli bacterium]